MVKEKSQGWIKVDRGILSDPVVNKSVFHFKVWMWLLLSATHAEREIWVSGHRCQTDIGEIAFSMRDASEKIGLCRNTLKKCLADFSKAKMIDLTFSISNTLVKIKKWRVYQLKKSSVSGSPHEPQNAPQSLFSGSPHEPPSGSPHEPQNNFLQYKKIYKNGINKKREKNTSFPPPKFTLSIAKEMITDFTKSPEIQKALTDFVETRIEIKKAPTKRALEISLHKLSGLAMSDEERLEIINNSIEHGWMSFYPLKAKKESKEEHDKRVFDNVEKILKEGGVDI